MRYCPALRKPSHLDVTKLVLMGQVSSQAKIVTENSRFIFGTLSYEFLFTKIISKIDMQNNC